LKVSLLKALNKPIHILIGQKKDAVRRISIRPISLVVIIMLTLALAGIAGKNILAPVDQRVQQQKATNLQQVVISTKLSEAEALLSLRDAQIESMQEQLQQDRVDMQQMRQRLNLFDQVLAERKVAGVHFLQPSAFWKDAHTIAYQLILVKGKNYPRWIIGHLTFTVKNSKGDSIALPVSNKKNSGGKIEMTTQTFIEGALAWPDSWQPKLLTITLINHKGRNKGNITIPIDTRQSSGGVLNNSDNSRERPA